MSSDTEYGSISEQVHVDAVPGERFSFRWVHPECERPVATNSTPDSFTL